MKLYLERSLNGIAILVVGLMMRYYSFTQIKASSSSGVTPRDIPLMVSNIVIILALALCAQGVYKFIQSKKSSTPELSKVKFYRFPFLLFILMIVYATVMQYVGYFLASYTILPLMLYCLRIKNLKYYCILAAVVFVVYLLIDVFLQIGLPKFALLN